MRLRARGREGSLWHGAEPRQDRSPKETRVLLRGRRCITRERSPRAGSTVSTHRGWPSCERRAYPDAVGGSLSPRLIDRVAGELFSRHDMEPSPLPFYGYVGRVVVDDVALAEMLGSFSRRAFSGANAWSSRPCPRGSQCPFRAGPGQ